MAGWCFGTFFHILGIIIPTEFHIFQRGRYTTNQELMGYIFTEGSLEVKLPTIWTDEKQSREEAERRERLEERRVEETESEERRCRCAKR